MKSFWIFILIILCTSCRYAEKPTKYEAQDPAGLNEGYLFDSLAYGAWESDILAKEDSTSCKRRWFFELGIDSLKYYEICKRYGQPEDDIIELNYGFEYDTLFDCYTFGMQMYIDSECQPLRDQRYYRASKILNHPNMRVIWSVWRDESCYRELYFLINQHDTVLFDGFETIPTFVYGI